MTVAQLVAELPELLAMIPADAGRVVRVEVSVEGEYDEIEIVTRKAIPGAPFVEIEEVGLWQRFIRDGKPVVGLTSTRAEAVRHIAFP
jgi:hypothetical protein